ncbi:MAG: hypothetical protein KDJ50_01250 [Alphaproteobacteria bacterium]|nr:hypothetical protein [Alphaproteobacteria bacterium]
MIIHNESENKVSVRDLQPLAETVVTGQRKIDKESRRRNKLLQFVRTNKERYQLEKAETGVIDTKSLIIGIRLVKFENPSPLMLMSGGLLGEALEKRCEVFAMMKGWEEIPENF